MLNFQFFFHCNRAWILVEWLSYEHFFLLFYLKIDSDVQDHCLENLEFILGRKMKKENDSRTWIRLSINSLRLQIKMAFFSVHQKIANLDLRIVLIPESVVIKYFPNFLWVYKIINLLLCWKRFTYTAVIKDWIYRQFIQKYLQ